MNTFDNDWILVLDFGSQYTQLIARRIRELHVYCEIHPWNRDLTRFRDQPPAGVVLSGGPSSVFDENAPSLDETLFSLDLPVLGICYGLQALIHTEETGHVDRAGKREYGRGRRRNDQSAGQLKGVG